MKQFLEAINQEITATQYGENPPELYEPISYIMALGGKRMRPLLTVLATHLFTDDWQQAVKPAIGVEIFHNFTLMHDDIMDAAPLRRGMPTVHEKWNTNIAILSGDVMLVSAYNQFLDLDKLILKRVLSRFNKTAAEVCEGQQMDMNFSDRKEVSEEEYLEMIRLKTSVLLGFSMELGGIIAQTSDENIHQLYQIGMNIGIGFQLMDDILDVYGDPAKFGKQVGGDIIENKKTWLLIKALELSHNQPQAKALNEWLLAKNFDKTEKVSAVTEIYNQLNIKDLATKKMNEYFDKGFEALHQLKASQERKTHLENFAKALIERES